MEGPNYDCLPHQVKGWRTFQATYIGKDQISAIQQGVVQMLYSKLLWTKTHDWAYDNYKSYDLR